MPSSEIKELKPVTARAFIVGPQGSQRQRLARIAGDAGLEVAGEAAHPEEASTPMASLCAEIVLIDQATELQEVVRWVREMVRHTQKPSVAVFSPFGDAILAERVLRAGACGYFLKTDPTRTLVEGLRQLQCNGLYVSQSVGIMLVREFLNRGSADVQSEQSLSKRELQVLELVGLGLDTRDIANKLYISSKTVEAHRWRIKQKLNLRRSQDLTRYALRRYLEA